MKLDIPKIIKMVLYLYQKFCVTESVELISKFFKWKNVLKIIFETKLSFEKCCY